MIQIRIEQRQAIEFACRNYVQIIYQMESGEVDPEVGDAIRMQWHSQLLELTGLSTFEFGGLPACIRVDDMKKYIMRLYNALIEQMKSM